VLRVATVVEGVCVTLDPEFDFISTATEYLKEEGYYEQTARNLAEGAGQQAQKTAEALFTVPPKADDFLDRANRGDLHIDVTIDDGSNVLDKLAMRIAYSVLLAVGVLSSTILYSFVRSVVAARGGRTPARRPARRRALPLVPEEARDPDDASVYQTGGKSGATTDRQSH